MAKKILNKTLKKKSEAIGPGPIRKLFDIGFSQITELGGLVTYIVLNLLIEFFDIKIAIDLFVSLIFITLIATSIKYFFFKDRPVKQSTNNIVERLDASSFPSIHSMRVFALTFWLSMFFNNLIITIYLSIIAVFVIYSRIYLKKHYLIDVIGGIMFSILILLIQYFIIGKI